MGIKADCDIWGLCYFYLTQILLFIMRIPGFMLLLSGWALALAALGMLTAPGPRSVFVLIAMGVEVLGLVLVFRSHLPPKYDRIPRVDRFEGMR
jgi:hypothetical protein